MSEPRRGGVSRPAGTHRYTLAAVIAAAALAAAATSHPDDTAPAATTPLPSPRTSVTAPTAQAAALPSAEPVISPAKLTIPAIGVNAPVVPVGVDDTGAFAAPAHVDTVGWYRYGPGLDASAGSLVIGGHVDSAREGPGAFFRLRQLRVGEQLQITGTDGRTRTYTVTNHQQMAKSEIDLQTYFDTTGSPRITLFTCGGAFDRATRNYADNIVITAEQS